MKWKQYAIAGVIPSRKGGSPPPLRVNAASCIHCPTTGQFDMLFADPPYNLGVQYGAESPSDKMRPEDYHKFQCDWLTIAAGAVRPGGTLLALLPDEWVAEAAVYLKHTLHFIQRNWIKWHETFGVQTTHKFARTSRHVLYFVRPHQKGSKAQYTFNASEVMVPSARQLKYNDKRAAHGGKVMDDVWVISRVAGTFKEKAKGFQNQIPEELLARLVRVSTNPGDHVCEFFAGSGSLGRVCVPLARSYTGWEVNGATTRKAASRIEERCSEVRKELHKKG